MSLEARGSMNVAAGGARSDRREKRKGRGGASGGEKDDDLIHSDGIWSDPSKYDDFDLFGLS